MEKLYALVDCNNFFVSCERVFRPDLEDKPVLVLSSNDGCVVSRSNEVKDMGIKMAAPYYEIRDLAKSRGVKIFSNNFAIYGAISNRIMALLGTFTPEIEVYSIDEAFLDLGGVPTEKIEQYARNIAKVVKQQTGVPVSIGIASTKTLAKVASKIAKKHPELQGAKYLPDGLVDQALSEIEVQDIWGIGWKLGASMRNAGVFTASHLKKLDPAFVGKKYSVAVERTVLELNGTQCIAIGEGLTTKKNLVRSRSFGTRITELCDVENAVSTFISQGACDLRKRNSLAWMVAVFIRTDKHRMDKPQYSNFFSVSLPYATNDTIMLNKAALFALRKIFKKGLIYKKAGIMLLNIVPKSASQLAFDQDLEKTEEQKTLMETLDRVNNKYGHKTLHLASEGFDPKWTSRSNLRSPNYLTSWHEIPIVK